MLESRLADPALYKKGQAEIVALQKRLKDTESAIGKASHSFNLLDARRAISVTERQRYILRVRKLAQAVAEAYYAQREKLGFPGLKKETA